MTKLMDRYVAAKKAATELHDKAKADDRKLTDDERTEFDRLTAEARNLSEQIDQVRQDAEALAELDDFDEVEAAARPGRRGKVKSPGEIFVESEPFKKMMAEYPDGEIPTGVRPQLNGVVRVGSFENAVLTDPGLYSKPHKLAPAELEIIDLFKHLNVIEDAPKSIDIDRETFTNNAATYTEGSDASKAESEIEYTPDTVTLASIAHHIVVTTQALKYNNILRSRIDTRLINGVRAKAQAEVASTLLASVSLMQTQAYDTSIPVTLRKAITKAMKGIMAIGGTPVIKVFIAPEDHEKLDIALLTAMVALAGQELQQTDRIWRAEVVPVFGLMSGVCFVGDGKQVDFYVGPGGIAVTTGWVDKQFIQNRLTILGEMDAKAAVIGGAALVATDLDANALPDLS